MLSLYFPSVNTSASAGAPEWDRRARCHRCALQCFPEQNEYQNTKGPFLPLIPTSPPVHRDISSPVFTPLFISSRFQSFNRKTGSMAMQTAQILTDFSQIYLIDNSV
ncbi:hypothetical protein FKM82_000090 [Ascaphus truei]